MARELPAEPGIYVPVINAQHMKRINHWELGTINNNWHLHRNYNRHIRNLLIFFQDYVASNYNYFNVIRFYLEEHRKYYDRTSTNVEQGELQNNEDIDSICLGLILHAYRVAAGKKLKYRLICATGDLFRDEYGGLRVKSVGEISGKFEQFIYSLKKLNFQKNSRACFICVVKNGEYEYIKKQSENKLIEEWGEKQAKQIDFIILKEGERLDDIFEIVFEFKKKHKRNLILIPFISLVVFIGSMSGFYLWQMNTGEKQFTIHKEVLFDPMDTLDWRTFKDDKESQISITSVPGRTDNAIEITYDLPIAGWILITKEIKPGALAGVKGIRFYYRGEGKPNSLEFKLTYKDKPTLGFIKYRATATDGWVPFIIFFEELRCWACKKPPDKCKCHGYTLNLEDVYHIDIGLSNKEIENDEPGTGRLLIDDMSLIFQK